MLAIFLIAFSRPNFKVCVTRRDFSGTASEKSLVALRLTTILEPINSYKRTTPDIIINGQRWEIKSPTTTKLSTFENRFKDASHQSKYIVMDLRRLQIDEDKALRYLERLIRLHRRVQRVLVIKKDASIVGLK